MPVGIKPSPRDLSFRPPEWEWMWRDAALVLPMWEQGGVPRDYSGNPFPLTQVGTPTPGFHRAGSGVLFPESTNPAHYYTVPTHPSINGNRAGDFSIATVIDVLSLADNNRGMIATIPTSFDYWQFYIRSSQNGGGLEFFAKGEGGSNATATWSVDMSAQGPIGVVAIVRDVGGVVELYANGRQVATASGFNRTADESSTPLRIGGTTGGSDDPMRGYMHCYIHADRPWTVTEASQWSRDPYGWMREPARLFPAMYVAAAGVSVLPDVGTLPLLGVGR